jgi:hypothetical protein
VVQCHAMPFLLPSLQQITPLKPPPPPPPQSSVTAPTEIPFLFLLFPSQAVPKMQLISSFHN